MAAQLISLKVLYLSSPPWQHATLVPRPAHVRPAVSCLMFLAMKDDPPPKLVYQRQHTANEELILTTAVEGREKRGKGGGRV